MDEKPVKSKSGNDVYVSEERTLPFEFAIGSDDGERIEKHIEMYVGKIDMVYHELISDLVHIDVHHIKPTPERNVHTLVTTGMSDLPMAAPAGSEEFRFAELLVTLPPDWQIGQEEFKDEKNYWIVRVLKMFARFPHEYETWLWWGHTIPNGNPPLPYHESTNFVGSILVPPISLPREFLTLKLNESKTIHFFSLIPLYAEEMQLKLDKGMDRLFDLFDKHGINEIVDIDRRNVAKKKWSLFG